MKKILFFALTFYFFPGAQVRGADSVLHITLTRSAAGFTASSSITDLKAATNIEITIAGSASNTDLASLLIFKDGGRFSSPQARASHGKFVFPDLTAPEKQADSVIFQGRIGGQTINLKLFTRSGGERVTPPAGTGNRTSAGGTRLDPGKMVYDAIRLGSSDLSIEERNTRLNYYLGKPATDALTVNDTIQNAYLADYIQNAPVPFSAQGAASPLSFQSILSAAGGLDVTTLADGLAKFLVARTKQELLTSFFSRFQQEMTNDDYKDLRILFPATYQKLNAIGIEIYQFDLYKQALREAFATDLKNLLTNVPEVVKNGRFKDWFDQHKDIKAIVLSGIYIYSSLADGKHPGEVIADYDLTNLDGIGNEIAIKGAIQTVQQVSDALRSSDPDHYWTSLDSIRMAFSNPLSRSAFMGLFWIRAVNIKYSAGANQVDSLRGVINKIHDVNDSLTKFQEFLTRMVEEAHTVEATLTNLKHKKNSQGASFVYEDYYSLINQSLDLIRHFSEGLQGLPYIRNVYGIGAKVDFYALRAKEINEIGLDISTANYNSAIVTLGSLYDSLTIKAAPATVSAADRNAKATTLKDIIRYGILMAGVVTAKNSDEVEKAIESVALPAGSSRIKRESLCNIALNAFVGLHGGHETIKNADNGSALNAFGLTAPVGVAFSWGTHPVQQPGGRIKGGKSNGVFLSLIDIGAVTTLRFGDTTTSRLPTIELRNIVAPGIFYSHGFGKCPLSLNVGIQYGPRLRELKSNSATVLDNGYWRVGLSLLMDIPLLNFYNKN